MSLMFRARLIVAILVFLSYLASAQFSPDTSGASLQELLDIEISTAAKYAQTSSDAPSSVTIITREDIDRFGYRNLADLLSAVRSFYISYDRNYHYLGSRGFSRPTDYNDRLLLLLNGLPVNENFYGSAPFGNDLGFNFDAVERIEIVRGPGSALYGTGAMFSVINIITRSGTNVDGWSLRGTYGSFQTKEVSGVFGTKFDNGTDLFISGIVHDSNGPDLYFPELDHPSTNFGTTSGSDRARFGGIFLQTSYKQWRLQGMFTASEKGIPTAPYGTIFNDSRTKSLDAIQLFEVRYEDNILPDVTIDINLYLNSYIYRGSWAYSTLSHDANDAIRYGTDVHFDWDLRPDDRLTCGLDIRNNPTANYRNWDADTTYFDNNYPYLSIGAYLQNEYQPLENLAVILGLRIDRYSSIGTATSPRIAVVYHPWIDGTVKFLLGQAFRFPNVYELYYEDAASHMKSNPSLSPEQISTYELVYEQRLTSELYAVGSVYRYNLTDLIDQQLDPVDSLYHFMNVSKVRATGAELDLRGRLDFGFQGYASIAFQLATDLANDEQLSNSPQSIFKFGINQILFSELAIGAETRYESKRITVIPTIPTGSFWLTRIHCSWKPRFSDLGILQSSDKFLELTFSIDNLFDESYATPGGFEHLQTGIVRIYQDGRTMVAGMRVWF